MCLDSMGKVESESKVKVFPCHGFGGNQVIVLSISWLIAGLAYKGRCIAIRTAIALLLKNKKYYHFDKDKVLITLHMVLSYKRIQTNLETSLRTLQVLNFFSSIFCFSTQRI